jgi:hypothetical protein
VASSSSSAFGQSLADLVGPCKDKLVSGWRPNAQELRNLTSLANASQDLNATRTFGRFRTGAAPSNMNMGDCKAYNWIHIANATGPQQLLVYPKHGSTFDAPLPSHHPDGSLYTRGVDYCPHSHVTWAVYGRVGTSSTIYTINYGQQWGKDDGSGKCVYQVANGFAPDANDYGVDFSLIPKVFSELWIAENSWSHDHETRTGPQQGAFWGSYFEWQLR